MKERIMCEGIAAELEGIDLGLHFAINSGFQTANVSSFCVSRVNFRGSDHMA